MFFSVFLFIFFFNYFIFSIKISFFGRIIYTFFNKKWFFDKFYIEFIGQTFFNYSYTKTYKQLDKGLFELIGPFGFSSLIFNKSISFSKNQSGNVYHYAFIIFFSFILIISFFIFEMIPFFNDFRFILFYFIIFIFI